MRFTLPANSVSSDGRNVFLVAPDQPVAPFLLAKARREQAALAVLRRLVDRLDGLKRERDAQRRNAPAGGVILPFPNQFRARRATEHRLRSPAGGGHFFSFV